MMKNARNMATGAMIGVAIGAMIIPQLDRKYQRNIKKVGKRARCMAEDAYDTMLDYMK
ncbi:YtxH domain-containing protein [Clostridium sp.]|uniref:YtxH domain-containing protein n=1 Tax=Clostridium sp. TaxID=1506 RepID=UPI00262FB34A|nr:YtxH domain-containing protein [Clostridium sp.]